MKLLLISPYHTGSHKAWAEGYTRNSQHEVRLLTLPGQFWKWRLQGGAVALARLLGEGDFVPEAVLATSMLDVATWLGLVRGRVSPHIPVFLYMHENQLTYPLPEDGATGPMRRQLGERDRHYALINYKSMLVANQVFFNSHYHRESFFAALPNLLKHFPDYNELETIPSLVARSQVLPVGIDLRRFDRVNDEQSIGGSQLLAVSSGTEPGEEVIPTTQPTSQSLSPPLILWNQRWEYDKNPPAFFRVLYRLMDAGLDFTVALCGENFRLKPQEFDMAIARLGKRVIHAGYADEATYKRLLWAATVTVSTAHHEFFGISILEALYCHTFPVLPYRLSYPELIPEVYHLRCLYENDSGLEQRLRWAILHPTEARQIGRELARIAAAYDWSIVTSQYDRAISQQTEALWEFRGLTPDVRAGLVPAQ